jgi:glycosyltransferase involved in cell wall biosynthesis
MDNCNKTKKTKNINLLVFAREYPIGMAGTKRIQHLIDYLIKQNILINIISFRSKNKQPAVRGVYNSVPYLNIGAGTDMKLTHFHKIIVYYIKGLSAILSCRNSKCTNIIYNSGGINIENLLFIFWAKILGYKLIFAIEEDYAFFKDEIKLISRFKIRTIENLDFLTRYWAEAIIVISTYLKEKYTTLSNKPVILIPVTARQNFNNKKKGFNAPLRVLYAGTFADKDGVNDIIEGFMLFNKVFENAQLILTGKSSQQLLYKEKFSAQKNLIFKGYIPDNEFYQMLRDADILCMCRTESGFANAGFPFKLGEYLATGNPVICTKVSDVETYLTEKDAYLINPNNPQEITVALTEIVKNPEIAKIKGINGLEKCRKYFSPEANGRLLYDLLIAISGPTSKT